MCRGIGLTHRQALKEPIWAVPIAYRGYMNNLSLIHHGKKIIGDSKGRKKGVTAQQFKNFVREHNLRIGSSKRARDRRSSTS